MRRSLLLLTTMALALLMVSSVALALNRIQCPNDPSGACFGTFGDDTMSGTEGYDQMSGGPGNDKLNGYGDNDVLFGGDGNDISSGGGNLDYLDDWAGTNTLNGGADSDEIHADYGNLNGGNEISKISGGSGDDRVWAADNAKDTINCGKDYDYVITYDPSLDVLRGCEADGSGNPLWEEHQKRGLYKPH